MIAPGSVSDPGAYALVGMGAMLAATTHSPLMSSMMLFELTHDYEIIVPLLVACTLASAISRRLSPGSIYTEEFRSRGIPWESGAEERALRSVKISDIMRPASAQVLPSTPLGDIIRLFLTSRVDHVHVVDSERRLAGTIDLHTIKDHLKSGDDVCRLILAADLMTKPFAVSFPDESLIDANEKLWLQPFDVIPVVKSSEDPTFLGVVTRRDLLVAVDREVLKRNVRLARATTRTGRGDFTEGFELPAEHRLEGIPVPPSAVGRPFLEVDLRRRFNLNLLAIQRIRPDGVEERFVPGPESRAEAGDVWIVLGSSADIERFAAWGRGVAASKATTPH
jgi:CIC family chloride channel protein